MMEITEFDKKVYNLYLSSVRKKQGTPYKLRKDFSTLDENKVSSLKKLSSLFKRVPHLMNKEFFEAPYDLYNGKYFDLDFYASPKSIGAYTKFIRNKENKDPDDQIEYLKSSYMFIYNFCKSKNIKLSQYPFYKSVCLEDCLRHIKDHNVSMYVIFSFPELYSLIVNMESDVYKLYFGELNLVEMQNKLLRSKVAFPLTQKLKEVISIRLNKVLENEPQV
jgi:hypothetical protein